MERIGQFRFTSITWHELPLEKALDDVKAVEKLLKGNLNIQNYGDEIDYLFFIFIIDLPNSIHKEGYRFYRQKRHLDFQLKLDYFEVLAATPEDVKAMMANLFLNSILLYKKMRMKNFDSQRFYADVKSLFEKNGLVRAKSVGNEVGK